MKIETDNGVSLSINLVYNDDQKRLIEVQVKTPFGSSGFKMAYPLAKLFLRDFQRIVDLCGEEPGKIGNPTKADPEPKDPPKKSRFSFLHKSNESQK